MSSLSRTLKLHWRRLLNLQTVTIDGVTVSTDQTAIPRSVRSALFKEFYEDHERALVRQFLKPGGRVLEIGAGIGFVSILCARIAGEGNVRSYEANLRLEPIIRRNYALNGLKPDLRMRAITVDGEPISFFRNDNIVSSSTLERSGFAEKITVESDALEAVIAEFQPTAIIMDVEGAEVELLSKSSLAGVRDIVVEVHPHITGDDKVATMRAVVEARGFSARDRSHKTIHFSR